MTLHVYILYVSLYERQVVKRIKSAYIIALTEQVAPKLCIKLPERWVVWEKKTISKLQKAGNLNITIGDSSFDLLY